MEVPDYNLYEYALVRYVPRVDREEFVNIGLVMMLKRRKWLKSLILIDPERIEALYPKSNLECLEQQCKVFEKADVPFKDIPVEEKYRWLTAVKSACIQVSPSHPGILKDNQTPEEEFNRLMHDLVL